MTILISDKSDTRWLEIKKRNCTYKLLSAIPFSKEKRYNLERWGETTLSAWREVQKIPQQDSSRSYFKRDGLLGWKELLLNGIKTKTAIKMLCYFNIIINIIF